MLSYGSPFIVSPEIVLLFLTITGVTPCLLSIFYIVWFSTHAITLPPSIRFRSSSNPWWLTSGVLSKKQVSRSGTSNYIPQILWHVITCPCPWYLLLVQHSSYGSCFYRSIYVHLRMYTVKQWWHSLLTHICLPGLEELKDDGDHSCNGIVWK